MAKFTSGTWLVGPHTALLLPVTCGPSPLGGWGGAAGRRREWSFPQIRGDHEPDPSPGFELSRPSRESSSELPLSRDCANISASPSGSRQSIC